MTDSQDTNKQQQERNTSYEELERIADDLQELCDKQAIRLGKLKAQQQEPVAYDKTEINCFAQDLYDQKMREGEHGHYESMFHVIHQCIKKTSPQPSKPWVPLTEFDIDQIPYSCSHADSRLIAFAIEAKLKEKNQ